MRYQDRGAIATVFVILLAGGVLLGMLALAVDVGRLYAEREELQSGADGAVMAIAEQCARAKVSGDCLKSDLDLLAAAFADDNAGDGFANVMELCGVVPVSTTIPLCTTPVGNLTDCIPGEYEEDRPYLEVRTGTRTPGDGLLLPPSFAQTLLGNGDYAGTEVRACARATWGAPATGLAVTFSRCEWDNATNDGTDFPAGPPYPPNAVPDFSYEVVLKTHDSQGVPECPQGPPGFDSPGGFGWLEDREDGQVDCRTVISNDTAFADTGGVPPACLDLLDQMTTGQAGATVVFIPIYDTVAGQGSNTEYHIVGVAAFVPTGYFFSAAPQRHRASWLTGEDHCNGQEDCLYGYFVDVLRPGDIGSGDLVSFGATVISLVG